MSRIFSLIVALLIGLFSGVASADEWVFTFGGDVNFNSGNLKKRIPPPQPDGVGWPGQTVAWSYFTKNIKPLINGDLNFANIETVVTTRGDLTPAKETGFVFASHPNSIEHLIQELGFNWFSLSNNHAFDFGRDGMRETLMNFEMFDDRYNGLLYHGVGWTKEEALRVRTTVVKGLKVAFVAIGIMDPTYRPTATKPGMLDYWNDEDYFKLLDNLAATDADYKVVSIHYGTERQVDLNEGQAYRFRLAATRGGANLILGHHPHVVRPVELYPPQNKNDKRNGQSTLIFYSFGNYLMQGAADMDNMEPGLDWGMMGRLYLTRNSLNGPVIPSAVELVPLKGMHDAPKAISNVSLAQDRLMRLRQLGLRNVGKNALDFEVNSSGQGLACLSAEKGYRAQEICN